MREAAKGEPALGHSALGLPLTHAAHGPELALPHAALHHLSGHPLPALHLAAALAQRTVLALHSPSALRAALTHALPATHPALPALAAACAALSAPAWRTVEALLSAATIAALYPLTRSTLLHPRAALTTLTPSALARPTFTRPTLASSAFTGSAFPGGGFRGDFRGGLPALLWCELFEHQPLKLELVLHRRSFGFRCRGWGRFNLVLRIHDSKRTGERGRGEG